MPTSSFKKPPTYAYEEKDFGHSEIYSGYLNQKLTEPDLDDIEHQYSGASDPVTMPALDQQKPAGEDLPPDDRHIDASSSPQYAKEETQKPLIVHAVSDKTDIQLRPKTTHLNLSPSEGFERLSQIDYWVKITGGHGVSSNDVLGSYRDATMRFTKSSGIHGYGLEKKKWCNLELDMGDSIFTDLVVYIQLADSSGPISEQELTRFAALISCLSEDTERGFAFMTMFDNAIEQANVLDEFINHFNFSIRINIYPIADQPFNGVAVEQYACQVGMERNHGYYSCFKTINNEKMVLYSLKNMSETGCFDFENFDQSTMHGLTFFMKPAAVQQAGAVFSDMVDASKACASSMQGIAKWPGYNIPSEEPISEIRESIENIETDMERLGIPMGSDEAIRLF